MITLKSLIKVAPFSDETRNGLIESLDKMTDDQKFRLSETCWTSISAIYNTRLQRINNQMMWEMAKKVKHYSRNDFQEVEAKLLYEFAHKLEASQSEEDLAKVREKLKKTISA